jgi:hypothetical protein
MRIRRAPTNVAVENRWLMILPALALTIGCESKPDIEASAEPEQTTTGEVAQPEAAQPKANEAATALAVEPIEAARPIETTAAPNGVATEQVDPAKAASAAAAKTAMGDRAAPAPDVPAAVQRGPAAKGDGFNAWLEGHSQYALNQPAQLTLVLTADDPFKCNEQYPYRFTLATGAGIQVPEPVVRGMHVEKHRSTMTVPFTPTKAGKHTVSGELAFSVCTEDKCLIDKQTLSFPVDVGGS